MKSFSRFFLVQGIVLIFINSVVLATAEAEKQIQYLSGTDNQNTVSWEFFCTGGRKSGYWTRIEVPSCWEQQGFGSYNYGRDYHTYGPDFRYADEKGMYKHSFAVPASWRDREINIVFEGSMTDTEVKINGKAAGEIHQGSFYRFKYNITDKLLFDRPNLLEVTVSKMSDDASVNYAERYADYWIFGGIFRPVYLEAYPREYISRTAIAASADGTFSIDVFTENIAAGRDIVAEIADAEGKIVKSFSRAAGQGSAKVNLSAAVENPLLWSSETPNLYKVRLCLRQGKKTLYQSSEKFGFRTVQIRPGDGIYINDRKIKMKGINRHVFWPETGRTVNPGIDLMDVKLMKEMNMNSVRCSHYPPDKSFLEYCDSLGLYVIDELAGWQNAYDTEVGEKLVREMVIRDVNHPSVIFWSNGNEGGTNKELDDDYRLYDLSDRAVIHAHHKPGNAFNFIDTNHYESYESTKKILQDSLIYMTTEFLHCQNDGGCGAGLQDYWELMWESPKSAGGYLWALIDEGVVRTDLGGVIDVNGVNAPDGVLGPHREKEGSFFAIKEIFSPVSIAMDKLPASFNGQIELENRFDFINLNQCEFRWQLANFIKPEAAKTGYEIVDKGTRMGPDTKPGLKNIIDFGLPPDWKKADALLLASYDPAGNEIYKWSWQIKNNMAIAGSLLNGQDAEKIDVLESDSLLTLTAGGLSVTFSKKNGLLSRVQKYRSPQLHFRNGPQLAAGKTQFGGISHFPLDDSYVVEVAYEGDMHFVRWKLYKNGWLELKYSYSLYGMFDFAGVSFDFPETHVLSVRWLGKGPYRVWRNRMQGVTYNIWEKAYNNTITGTYPRDYPEFKGYYADVSWMVFDTVEGRFLVASADHDLFVRLFEFYGLPGLTPHPDLPPGDISFLDRIPPIGTKMSTNINARPETLGPASKPNNINGRFNRTLYFYFADFEKLQ